MVTKADMWIVCTRAAGLLDGANADWHRLFEVETALWPLVSALEGMTTSTSVSSRHLQLVRSSLSWVRLHAYDASEIELERRLALALRSAMSALECLEGSPYPTAPPSRAMAAASLAAGTMAERPHVSDCLLDARRDMSRLERAKAVYCAEIGTTRL